ncbi:MAG: methionyl-tRNA formyltransferase [Ruminococcus sp.]|nr:methionyl-tRNA formyltransferase [Ruminococcus sp.]
MGTPDFAVKALEKLAAAHNILAVFTQPDKPKGRKYLLTPPPVKKYALENGIGPVFQPQSLRRDDGPEFVEKIRELAPDCIVVAAYGQILPKTLLEIPKYGCVNIHGSLLPKLRGAAPIQRSVLNGDRVTGITTMLMGEGLDTGDMLEKKELEIGEDETSAELFDRMADAGAELVLHTLEGLEKGTVVPVKQDESQATYAAMITKDMCLIDFDRPVREVHCQIRGLSDSPCAYTTFRGKRLKVYHCSVASEKGAAGEPGTVVDAEHFGVACREGVIRFTEVQAEGGKRLKTADFLRGNQPEKGEKLG